MSDSSTAFDADARAAALTVPTLTIGRLLYRGRILSATEWLPWYERYLELLKQDGKDFATVRARLAFYRRYIATVFPRRRFKVWAPDPAEILERQPGNMLAEAFTHFFSLQLSAISGAEEQLSKQEATLPSQPAVPGSGSNGSTVPASDDAPPNAPNE